MISTESTFPYLFTLTSIRALSHQITLTIFTCHFIGFEAVKKLEGIAESEEDVLSYVAFPQQAEKFFQYREEHKGVKVTYSIKKVD